MLRWSKAINPGWSPTTTEVYYIDGPCMGSWILKRWIIEQEILLRDILDEVGDMVYYMGNQNQESKLTKAVSRNCC